MWYVTINESGIAPKQHVVTFRSLDDAWAYLGQHKATAFSVQFVDEDDPRQMGLVFTNNKDK